MIVPVSLIKRAPSQWVKNSSTLLLFVLGGTLVFVLAGANSQVRLGNLSSSRLNTKPTSLIPNPPASFLASLSAPSTSIETSIFVANEEENNSLVKSELRTISIRKGSRIFLFGDSMVHAGLSSQLGTLARKQGASLTANAWISSSTKMWATSDRLQNLLLTSTPDVVFVALGSNEVMLGNPESRAIHIQKIVQQLKGRPCVWVGPPVWKHETGIVSVLRNNSKPCIFFDSSQHAIERQPDGIHPNTQGGTEWANLVWKSTVQL